MVFSSAIFLLYFLPVFLLVYTFIPKILKNWWILIASICFYAWGAPQFVFILLGSTIIDFFIVQTMHRSEEKRKKKQLLILSLVLNVGLLAYFKYANFFVENVNSLLHAIGMNEVSWTSVALPIGISFYTFQTLTYSIDVYRGVHAPLKHLHNYLLYIMSFPQMIAGPIVRFNSIADQIVERKETIDDKLLGFFRFCIGLSKKVLIANVLGATANDLFGLPADEMTTGTAWIAILAYTFQIYFDFAGYSDMAIGLGKMMGFTFPENFNNPYTAKSITEFWRRWHITLGEWLKNYLYIPLGGNRTTTQRIYINLIIVFFISGLWHGASWNFVIWGLFHGIFLILDRLFLKKMLDKIGGIPSVLFTFFVVVIGWVFFRLETFDEASQFISQLFSFDGALELILPTEFYVILFFAILISFFTIFKIGHSIESALYGESAILSRALFSVLLFVLCLSAITAGGFNPFIYFRF